MCSCPGIWVRSFHLFGKWEGYINISLNTQLTVFLYCILVVCNKLSSAMQRMLAEEEWSEDICYKTAIFSFALKFCFSSETGPPAFYHSTTAFARYIMQIDGYNKHLPLVKFYVPTQFFLSTKRYQGSSIFFLRYFPETKWIRTCSVCGALIAVWRDVYISNWLIFCFVGGAAGVVLLCEQEHGQERKARRIKSKYLPSLEKIPKYL